VATVSDLRFGVLGCGFWSRYQLAGWREVGGVEPVGVYDPVRTRAEETARAFGLAEVHDSAEALLGRGDLDFVDIIAGVDAHEHLVCLAAERGIAVICQKPLAPSLDAARRTVAACHDAGVPLLVHENWRWQRPIRELGHALRSGAVGRPHRARLTYSTSFPVFENQPFLRELERFILTDIGTHVLDAARFLFGEARGLYCRTQQVNRSIRGEDVATVVMEMDGGVTVTCELSYSSPVEHDRFPETYIHVECENGSLEIAPDYWLRVTTKGGGTLAHRCPPPFYPWADARYAVVHGSIVECARNLLGGLRGEYPAETTGEDNLRTLALVYAAYVSAAERRVLAEHELRP
jgi:D-apiose dehydrogenase